MREAGDGKQAFPMSKHRRDVNAKEANSVEFRWAPNTFLLGFENSSKEIQKHFILVAVRNPEAENSGRVLTFSLCKKTKDFETNKIDRCSLGFRKGLQKWSEKNISTRLKKKYETIT